MWRPRRLKKQIVYVRQEPVNIEALAAKMAEEMVAKILDKLPASTTTIIHHGRATSGSAASSDQPETISIDSKVLAPASADISDIEKSASIQDTKTTVDDALQSSKDKLARLKKG